MHLIYEYSTIISNNFIENFPNRVWLYALYLGCLAPALGLPGSTTLRLPSRACLKLDQSLIGQSHKVLHHRYPSMSGQVKDNYDTIHRPKEVVK